MNAALSRACVISLRTFGTDWAQRGRRCMLQVWLVKSIASKAVSFATRVAGLSAGGGGTLAAPHSSIRVWACAPAHRPMRARSGLNRFVCHLVICGPPEADLAFTTLTAMPRGAKPVQA